MKNRLKQTLPWLICIGLFVYIFTAVLSPAEAWKALKLANIPLLIVFAVGYFFYVHLLDTLSIRFLLNRYVTNVTFREMWFVRGVSYIVMILNYHAGQGAFAVYLKKTHQAPIAKTLSVMAFMSMIDLAIVYTCAIAFATGTPVTFNNFDFRLTLMASAPFFYLFVILWILFWKFTDRPFMQSLKKLRPIRWVLDHNIFMIFREATFSDYIKILLIRLPISVIAIISYNFAMIAFHSFINWVDILVINPIIMVAGTIPITPSGFGTGQILTIGFFRNLVKSPLIDSGAISSESLLFTSSIVWAIANMILKALFGALCLSRTSKDLFLDENSPVQ